MKNPAESLLARLKNESKKKKISLQQLLNLFCQEELIRRISDSSHKEKFILKGGYLLYSISKFTTRPTIDADYLLKNHSNNINAIKNLVTEIISIKDKNPFIEIKIKNLEKIAELKKYHGVRVNLIGIIGRTKTPFSVDFGIDDIVIPKPRMRTLPVLLSDFEEPQILTYSLESTIAEKIDAIISLMETTGRMKDFYDIYYLATTLNFDGKTLQKAIYATLKNRERSYGSTAVSDVSRLIQDPETQKKWTNFCNKILNYHFVFCNLNFPSFAKNHCAE